MAYPGRQSIYDAAIRRMVRTALAREEEEFAALHETDTDEALLELLRACARRLHRSPLREEMVGGSLMCSRFGSWDRALQLAGLPPAPKTRPGAVCGRVRREEERQKAIYRQKKTEKKELAAKRRAARNAAKK